MAADTSLSILGPNTMSAAEISAWYHGLGKGNGRITQGETADTLIDRYLVEGDAQGVRGDLAFAQACWETGYFTNPDTARNNFAGIAHPDGAPAGLDFATPFEGVRAQIQLLAKVVGGNSVSLAYPDVAPSWQGKQASTVGGLTRNWASDPAYANHIISVFNGLLGAAVPRPQSDWTAPGDTATSTAAAPVYTPAPVAEAKLPAFNLGAVIEQNLTGAEVQWPFNPAGTSSDQLAAAVTAESTVDLTVNQLPQVQLTVADPGMLITGTLPGNIVPTDGTSQPINFRGETLTVAEVQTIAAAGGVDASIITLRPSVLCWMATKRVRATYTGVSATDWIMGRVAEFNATLPPGVAAATFSGEVTSARPSILLNPSMTAVTQWQSYYDLAQQMAGEEGFWLWETAGGVFFGKPTWIATFAPSLAVAWPGFGADPAAQVESLSIPVCLRSLQLFTGDTAQFTLPRNIGMQVRPGHLVNLVGPGFFTTKRWVVKRVQWTENGTGPVQITCNEVFDPVPSLPGGVPPNPPTSDPTGRPPTATNLQFVDIALKEVGVPYLWGGTSPSAGFDCSGLVMWALNQLGITFPHYSGDQYAHCAAVSGMTLTPAAAMNVRGALLFKNAGKAVAGDHVAISMGDGTHVLQAPHSGTDVQVDIVPASYFDVAAFVPELNYGGGAV